MKLALLGMGRMGTELDRVARAAGHEVVARIDIATDPNPAPLPDQLQGAEVVIDFTVPDAVLENIQGVAAAGLPMVVGTTGWYDAMDQARGLVAGADTGLIWGSNFSIGAQVLMQLVRQAATLLDRFPEYDPSVFEHHHTAKKDAPSGTALTLAQRILDRMGRKHHVQSGNPDGAIDPTALHVTSLRAGEAFGHHRVRFDAAAESIELVHTAHSRDGFVLGALYAAEWIKDRTGFYEFSQLFERGDHP